VILGSFDSDNEVDAHDDEHDDEHDDDALESTSSESMFVLSADIREVASRNANVGLVRLTQQQAQLHAAQQHQQHQQHQQQHQQQLKQTASGALLDDLPLSVAAVRSRQVSIGFADVQGVRESMEDATVIQPAFCDDVRSDLVAIFDGHGGAEASLLCARALPHYMGQRMAALLDHVAAEHRADASAAQLVSVVHASLADTQRQLLADDSVQGGCTALVVLVHGDQCIVANVGDSRAVLGTLSSEGPLVRSIQAPSDDIVRAVTSPSDDTDLRSSTAAVAAASTPVAHATAHATSGIQVPLSLSFSQTSQAQVDDHHGGGGGGGSTSSSTNATTNATNATEENRAHVSTDVAGTQASGSASGSANRRVHVVRVTRDHKPDDVEETARVKQAGGFVARGRVCAVLAVSRALGDRFLIPYLSCTADYYSIENWRRHSVLILACDGVWDVLSDVEVVAIAHSTRDAAKAARRICTAAISQGSTDNVSVVVIRFDGEAGFVRRLRRADAAVAKRRKVTSASPPASNK
jgi:serine/threonine protein phosphatase PrpC